MPPNGKPKQSQIADLLRPNPDLQRGPGDRIPGAKDGEPDIDKDFLSEELVKSFRQCIQDRAAFGFETKRRYDDEAYYGIKNEFFSNWPWPGASNFLEPITPTLVDVGVSHVHETMFRDVSKTILVEGIGKEDSPYAPLVSHVLNFEVGIDSNMIEAQGDNIFRTFQKGTGFLKTWVDFGDEFKIRNASIPIHLCFKPIYKSGCQRADVPYIHQLIPLNENEWKFRQGIGRYEHLEAVTPGWGMGEALTQEDVNLIQSQITGLDVTAADSRDMRYLVETPITHYPKGKFKALELIVTWSPKNGIIHRVVENKDLIRNMSDYWFYKNAGFAYHRSMPEILRDIQEKANYTDKQVTDAADKAITPAAFIEQGSGFDPNENMRAPTGMYEVAKGTKITFEQPNIAAIIERGNQIDRLWDKAERRTGLTEIFQGLTPERRQTATTDRLRNNKAENRFKTLLKNYGVGWRNTANIIYELTDRNIPKKKLIMILGSADYSSTKQIFPQKDAPAFGMGLNAQFNFSLAAITQGEKDEQDARHTEFLNETIKIFGNDKAALWKSYRAKAELINFKDWERIVSKPPEADIMAIDEVFQRIESGETGLQPSPFMTDQILLEYFRYRIRAHMITDRYKNYPPEQKQELDIYAQNLERIMASTKLATFEHRAKSEPDIAAGLDMMASQFGAPGAQGGQPGAGAPPPAPPMPGMGA